MSNNTEDVNRAYNKILILHYWFKIKWQTESLICCNIECNSLFCYVALEIYTLLHSPCYVWVRGD